MIPAPFMDRHDTVRRLEAAMVLAVVQYANDAKARAIWDADRMGDFISDYFRLRRRYPDGDFDAIV